MPVAVPRKTIELFSQTAPANLKKTIQNALGNHVDDIDVMFNMVLVAIYIRPERTSGNIIRPDSNVVEDLWQGKVGLVIKHGPDAFQDDEVSHFHGQKVLPGEWCAFRIGDSWQLNINDVPCRLIEDSHIKLKVRDPSVVF